MQAWWRNKADELHDAIPDFGGFLVKASSEGQPGPTDYGRTHADGANLLARAVAPYGGIVMWRAFVYDASDGDVSTDAFDTFTPLDGAFDDNVLLQAKYGPNDFHALEPVHPLFGAMRRTHMMLELQITQEHTGHETDLCYLPVWWKQVLDFDTHAGGTVAEIVGGGAGVINFGDDRNWTGSHLAAANTHGYGRLLWDPGQRPRDLAREWIAMTFGTDGELRDALESMLLGSWQTFVDYTSPLGLSNMVAAAGGALRPRPRRLAAGAPVGRRGHRLRPHGGHGDRLHALLPRASERSLRGPGLVPGRAAAVHAPRPVRPRAALRPDLIDHIYEAHFAGLEAVLGYRDAWRALGARVDDRRHREVLERFDQHVDHATRWRDTIVA